MAWDGAATTTRATSQVAVSVRMILGVKTQFKSSFSQGSLLEDTGLITLSQPNLYCTASYAGEGSCAPFSFSINHFEYLRKRARVTKKNIVLPYLETGNEDFDTGFVLQSCPGRFWLGSGQNEAQFQQELHLLLWSVTEQNTGMFWHLEAKYLAKFDPMC